MQNLKQHLGALLGSCLSKAAGIANSNANVITASKPEFGDYQANGVMAIAKQLQTNPRELAQKVVELIDSVNDKLIERVEIAGPGFINIHLRNDALMAKASMVLQQPNTLIPQSEQAVCIVVDYSSPNLAKEMHVGHLRGTIIGDCLARVLEKQGHEVIRQNHVGDWGTQFGMLIAYLKEVMKAPDPGSDDLPTRLADLEVFYRAARKRFDSDSEFAETSRLSVVKLQGGEPEYLQIWQRFIDESLRHCQLVYDRLNVTLSNKDLKAESFYNDGLSGIVTALEEKNLLTLSAGALCVFLPEFTGKDGDPLPVIIRKSDGAYLYATTDLAAVRYRCFDLNADRSLYVVDARQSLHFQQVFAVARVAGLASDNISLEHVTYGTMMGKDGKPFQTRSGDTIKLIELLNEACRRAFELVSDKNPDLDEVARQAIADTVGIAAVKYADLSKNRTSDYIFDWSAMLSFEGNTAPYLLYAYARIKSILSKQETALEQYSITSIDAREERDLLLKNLQLPEVIEMVATDCYPNLLCNYLYELAGKFMRFYEACPILKAELESRNSRLSLAALTAETLQQGLDLLGIETLEKM